MPWWGNGHLIHKTFCTLYKNLHIGEKVGDWLRSLLSDSQKSCVAASHPKSACICLNKHAEMHKECFAGEKKLCTWIINWLRGFSQSHKEHWRCFYGQTKTHQTFSLQLHSSWTMSTSSCKVENRLTWDSLHQQIVRSQVWGAGWKVAHRTNTGIKAVIVDCTSSCLGCLAE